MEDRKRRQEDRFAKEWEACFRDTAPAATGQTGWKRKSSYSVRLAEVFGRSKNEVTCSVPPRDGKNSKISSIGHCGQKRGLNPLLLAYLTAPVLH